MRTVDDLIAWLSERGESYAYAFEKPKVIRAAIDHAHVKPDAVDRRRARDRVLSADDRRLKRVSSRFRDDASTDRPTIRIQEADFDVAQRNRGADARPHRCRRGRELSPASAAAARMAKPIAALTLEHYPGMAEAEIKRHADEAMARWPLHGLTVIHRFGRITPGRKHRAGGHGLAAPRRRHSRRPNS